MSINIRKSFFSPVRAKFSHRINNICEKCPEFMVPKMLQKIAIAADKISTPGQRAVLMVSAIPTQTMIDLHNNKIDEDTRITSASRTLGKILAGGSVGIAVRAISIKVLNNAAKPGGFLWIEELAHKTPIQVKKYMQAVGTLLGIIVCLFTNFLLDAPIAIKLTNKFIDIFKQQKKDDKKRLDYYSSFPYPFTHTHRTKTHNSFKGGV